MVTLVPPAAAPPAGLMEETTGVATTVRLKVAVAVELVVSLTVTV
jgi:hypothetical protein